VVFGATVVQKNFNVESGYKSARLKINNINFAIADENTQLGFKSPLSLGGVPLCFKVELDDVLEWDVTPTSCTPKLVSGVEKCIQKALEMGGEIVSPSTNQNPILMSEDGMQFCNIKDPFGFVWSICRKQQEGISIDTSSSMRARA